MKRRDVINELEQSTVGHVDKQARPGSSVTMNAPTATPVLWLQPELYRIRDAAVVLGVSPPMGVQVIQSGALPPPPNPGPPRAPAGPARASRSAGVCRPLPRRIGPVSLFKRCACEGWRCAHPWWYRFRLNGRFYRSTTQTHLKQQAADIEARERS